MQTITVIVAAEAAEVALKAKAEVAVESAVAAEAEVPAVLPVIIALPAVAGTTIPAVVVAAAAVVVAGLSYLILKRSLTEGNDSLKVNDSCKNAMFYTL